MVSEALGQEPVKKTTLNAEFAEHAEQSRRILSAISAASAFHRFVPPEGITSVATRCLT